jgi:hypothetical protein
MLTPLQTALPPRSPAAMLGAFLAALFCIGIATPAAFAAERWETHRNARFGYVLSYPSSVFEPQPPSEKGDGQTFLSKDGRAKIVVYATVNDERFSPAQYRSTILKQFAGYNEMDYSPRGKTWFVLSGFRDDVIYYQKVMFSCGERVINALSVTFPRKEKKFYEGLIEVMEDSFKPGSGEGCR